MLCQKEYYNEKTGYSEQLLDISNVFIAHTRGVTASKGGDELGEGMEGIGQMSYIPNPLRKVRTVSIDRYAR